MIRRMGKNLGLLTAPVPDASVELERDGCTIIRGVLDAATVTALVDEADRVFQDAPPERNRSDREEFRYQLLNRSELALRTLGHPRILEVIEPLLGNDCHVIANTLWRNPPEFGGGPWHCDAGPHVPRPPDVAVGRSHPIPRVRNRRAHPAARLPPRRRPDRRGARQPPLGSAGAARSDPRSRADLRRPCPSAARRRGRRRRPVRQRRVAPRHACVGWVRTVVRAGPLRDDATSPSASARPTR